MTNDDWEKVLPLIERVFKLFDKYIDRKYPEQKDPVNVEGVWKQGQPLPEPKTPQEYRDYPSDQPGRFATAIANARRNVDTA
jgi:hypothetical protein